jgi:hypothetical protein
VRKARLPVSQELRAYQRLQGSDTCDCGTVEHSSEDATEVSASEWVQVVATRARLAAAGLTGGAIRRHTGHCACEGVADSTRLGLRVSLDLGAGVVVTREYGVSS